MSFMHLLSSYFYELPEELIAKRPLVERDLSRLMIVDRSSGNISEMRFRDWAESLEKNTHLIFNNTKVLPARLYGKKISGGQVEILLTKPLSKNVWRALTKPGKKIPEGSRIIIGNQCEAKVIKTEKSGEKVLEFFYEGNFDHVLNTYGSMPIPPYMKRKADDQDRERYQTVYAKERGAVAAPTAGLHFTDTLLSTLSQAGVLQTYITLHVGLGTFQPIISKDIREHQMHTESFMISSDAAQQINHTKGSDLKQICVGTTTCRTLESAVNDSGLVTAGNFDTNIFIYPGYQFRFVQSLLTNFHLPESSLMLLVSAFAGPDLIMEAYRKAVKEKFRFFSYGDAMLII